MKFKELECKSEYKSHSAERAKEIRETTGLNMTNFAEKYGIPYRTIQNWEAGVTAAPAYVLDLLAKAVATDRITPHVWVVETYRDKAGTGSQKVFGSKQDAIIYAMKEWDALVEADKRSYRTDPAGRFDVGLAVAEWDDVDEEWVPSPDREVIVWDALAE